MFLLVFESAVRCGCLAKGSLWNFFYISTTSESISECLEGLESGAFLCFNRWVEWDKLGYIACI